MSARGLAHRDRFYSDSLVPRSHEIQDKWQTLWQTLVTKHTISQIKGSIDQTGSILRVESEQRLELREESAQF